MGLIFFKGPLWGAYFWRGLSTEGNLHFKIDRASHIVGRKFTVFALFCFVFGGNFQVSTSPWGGSYLEGQFNGGLFALRVWGFIFGRANTWRGLFSEFYGMYPNPPLPPPPAKRASSKGYIYLTFLFRLVLLQTYSSPYDTSICTEPFIRHNLT